MRNLEIKIIKRLLNEFRMPEKELDVELDKLSPDEVSKALDDAIGNNHVNGKPYPSWLRSIKEDTIKKINLTTDPFKKFIETHVAHVSKHEDVLSIWRSFYLFTSASVSTIRDTSKYDATKSVNFRKDATASGNLPLDFIRDNDLLDLVNFAPSQADYKNASTILTYAASTKIKVYNELYRGITLSKQVCDSLAPGIQFQNWPISSWSMNGAIANQFANYDLDPNTQYKVILQIEQCEYGCEVGTATNYRSEEEVVMGKRLEITDVEQRGGRMGYQTLYRVTCKVID